jgi:hypothetical protein
MFEVRYENAIGGTVASHRGSPPYIAHITTVFVNGVCVGWTVARTYADSDAMAKRMVAERFGVLNQ